MEMLGIVRKLYKVYKESPLYYNKSGLAYAQDGAYKLIEQNPYKDSKWAALKRAGHEVVQFMCGSRYIGVILDGELYVYQGGNVTRIGSVNLQNQQVRRDLHGKESDA